MKKKNRFLANKTFVVFSILAVCIILTAVFAPVVTRGVDPLKGSLVDALLPPCKEHIFGTDKMGRDIFSRVIYGARASLSATFGVVALIFLVGTVTGVLAGYFGGVIDAVIMRIADMMLAFPGLVLALAVAGIMGASIKNAIIAIVVVSWTKYARLARSLVMKIRDRDYVSAAIVTGSKTPYMLFRYMLPNALPTLIITAAQIIPRIPASKRAVRTAQCSPSLSFAPKYLEIIIVAPVASPFIKLSGNLKSVCTESIAASPIFPLN